MFVINVNMNIQFNKMMDIILVNVKKDLMNAQKVL